MDLNEFVFCSVLEMEETENQTKSGNAKIRDVWKTGSEKTDKT